VTLSSNQSIVRFWNSSDLIFDVNVRLYECTFVVAYRYHIQGFIGLVLPRELVNIAIAEFIATMPLTITTPPLQQQNTNQKNKNKKTTKKQKL